MRNLSQEIKNDLKEALRLSGKSLYKTSEFQLLFKTIYLSILLFMINFAIAIFSEALETLIAQVNIGETFENIPITSLFNEVKIFIVLTISIFSVLYIYHVEKNGVAIITAEYYRNNFITFFKTLLLSLKKTPLFILRRLRELHIVIFILAGLYLLRKFLLFLEVSDALITGFTALLTIYSVILFLNILFRQSFTSQITCLQPHESYNAFNENVSKKFLHKKIFMLTIFYFVLAFAILLWLIFFYISIQAMLMLATDYTSLISFAIAFFIASTIVSILIILTLLKTFKSSIMTVLYYQQRKQQKKEVNILKKDSQPYLSKKVPAAVFVLFFIIFIGGTILTASIKTKTDGIITKTTDYIEREHITKIIDVEDISLEEMIKSFLSQDKKTLDTVEQIVFTYLFYITN